MRNLKLVNKNLNTMHDALVGLKDEIDNIGGSATRGACITAYNEVVKLFEFLDSVLS